MSIYGLHLHHLNKIFFPKLGNEIKKTIEMENLREKFNNGFSNHFTI